MRFTVANQVQIFLKILAYKLLFPPAIEMAAELLKTFFYSLRANLTLAINSLHIDLLLVAGSH